MIKKKKNVRRNLIPGNSKSLWKAVAEAKDINLEEIQTRMLDNGVEIGNYMLKELFAEFFESKVKMIM